MILLNTTATLYNASECGVTSTCGGESNSTYVTTPNFPVANYDPSTDCYYTIKPAEPGMGVALAFVSFRVTSSDNCSGDYVQYVVIITLKKEIIFQQIRSSTGDVLSHTCGNSIPTPVSDRKGLWIHFHADDSGGDAGFMAIYCNTIEECARQTDFLVTSSCGEVFDSGVITSPSYPLQYVDNTDCYYTITPLLPGGGVALAFVTFDLENDDSCGYDYVQIRSESASGNELLKRCGSNVPSPVYDPNGMWIHFHTDGGVVGNGFLAIYCNSSEECQELIDNPCGESTFLNSSGEITSPFYPYGYTYNTNCKYNIAPYNPESCVTLTFIDEFDIDAACNDYVEVINPVTMETLIPRTCGSNAPSVAVHAGFLEVRFHSDSTNIGKGFKAVYNECGVTSTCGGESNSTYVTTPNFPVANYDPSTDCYYTIKPAEPGMGVALAFVSFRVTSSDNCAGDYVQIRSSNGDVLSHNCGNNIPDLVFDPNSLWVHFHADGSDGDDGFMAIYCNSNPCGNTSFIGGTGEIMSPFYPFAYTDKTHCNYVISAAVPGACMTLTFTGEFDLEADCDDYVEVLNLITLETLVPRSCGAIAPSVQAKASKLLLRFHSNPKNKGKGFKAVYNESAENCTVTENPCGNTNISAGYGEITSPYYPYGYIDNIDCEYTIVPETPDHSYVRLNFVEVFEFDAECNDFVEVFDLVSMEPLHPRFCGSTRPSIEIQSPSLLVRFHSDSDTRRVGFKAIYNVCEYDFDGNVSTSTV
ncbi:tolloid-like protein 1 [Lingula anatina]|uniref:Tolloid-like protein 1 n=1 Tax=Lingula anatina TaxID=7574 RepID=A0A1S3ITZ3_LINAN|nr:tolloid-like protein 1 [Lingula anatina]|eukprot:XP_013401675.2 tolloid-like protein 1 [Lingula anatina]